MTGQLNQRQAGFSLMEVNMAVFVMAIGILGMVALFPLGLREGTQGRQDMIQSMFADHALNQLTPILSATNVTWKEWVDLDQTSLPNATRTGGTIGRGSIEWRAAPSWVRNHNGLRLLDGWKLSGKPMQDTQYRVFFQLVGNNDETGPAPSSRIMGIGVRSTEQNPPGNHWTNNVLYYGEVMFRGDPMK